MNWKFWKKCQPPKADVEIGLSMGEVYVNPSMGKRRERNLARIATIQEFIKTIPYGSPEYINFDAELKKRIRIEEAVRADLRDKGVI